MQIYNTLTQKKEEFTPLESGKVKMFVCGPTVYDYSHLGHARTYISYDMIAKWIKHKGFDLTYLMNVTDVDDKIIKRADESGVDPIDLANEFTDKFNSDMRSLGIDSITIFARATQHMNEIIDQIERLIKQGFAYITKNGVYFDISKFSDYGKLSNQNTEQLESNRIEPDDSKKNPHDFALWKLNTQGITWDSPWGKGRPGWHIEDTAIAEKYLGSQYDIHGGGRDLIFPHHEAEIAQMESVSGKKPFVGYWTHTGFLLVEGEKMAKSLGNFKTIQDSLKSHEPEVLRLFFLMTHYRSPIDYSEKNIEQAKNTLNGIYNTVDLIKSAKESQADIKGKVDEILTKFESAMDDDFNTPLALSNFFEITKTLNKHLEKNGLSQDDKNYLLEKIEYICTLFGIFKEISNEISPEAQDLIDQREDARKNKDFEKSDQIREKLRSMGIEVIDTKDGPKWKKI